MYLSKYDMIFIVILGQTNFNLMRISILGLSIAVLLAAYMFTGCFKEEFYVGDDVSLRFSTDTITFDTVFTTVGSATRVFKVYNDKDKPVKVSKVFIQDNKHNQFRLNIDGEPSNEVENLEIGANDSVYIFAETKINPDDPLSVSPFVVQDYLVFHTNGNEQKVLLEAWGQNANYITGKGKGKSWKISCDNKDLVWDDPKPYVIYGTVYFEDCVLKLLEGTQVHIHGGIAKTEGGYYYDGSMIIGSTSKILSMGTVDNPVVFQTDRLEKKYEDINALYYGIFFDKMSVGSELVHTNVQNATIGIYLDSMSEVSLNSCKILHIGSVGIYANHATLNASNCLVADIGGYNVVVDYGGNINLKHCTIYNNNKEDALVLKNYKCLNARCTETAFNPLVAFFQNSIIYGSNRDELLLSNIDKDNPAGFNYFFDHCIVQVDELLEDDAYPEFFNNTENCKNGAGDNPLFQEDRKYNYNLDTMSIAIDLGRYTGAITQDIDGKDRDSKPDLGCYEFQY